eukprot:gb/GECG01002355.1/.p1 GENE.gb/GECG01002355.1/~~gb/GECG01002355.1/.p1  ORF type:complete len:138 (+),score=4.80 gb/GECG01002355.1/:1-414(+)
MSCGSDESLLTSLLTLFLCCLGAKEIYELWTQRCPVNMDYPPSSWLSQQTNMCSSFYERMVCIFRITINALRNAGFPFQMSLVELNHAGPCLLNGIVVVEHTQLLFSFDPLSSSCNNDNMECQHLLVKDIFLSTHCS